MNRTEIKMRTNKTIVIEKKNSEIILKIHFILSFDSDKYLKLKK